MGVIPVKIHSASLNVRNALTILIFIRLCTLINFSLLCSYCKASIQTGAPYSNSGSIDPLCVVFSAPCLIPQDILNDLDKM